MNIFKKLIALLLFSLVSTTAFAVTDAEVFTWAEANYPDYFPGTPEAGQVQQYDYRFYRGSGNYLAVDTNGMIYVLGPISGNEIASVGTVASFADTIIAWEATQAGTGTTSGTTSRPAGLFTAAANPINLALTLDSASNATSKTVPSIGASTITATGSDGTTYRLDIPDGALLQDTVITMTPVSSISNLPFSGGLGGAVKLEPEGLFFYKDVTLTIVPKVAIPLQNQVFFGFSASGEDLILGTPVRPYGTGIQLSLQHFSGGGIANGVSAEKAAVLNRIANRVESRLASEVGDALAKGREDALKGGSDANAIATLIDSFTEYENSVVNNRITAAMAASASCADGTKAVQTLLGYERQRQLLGLSQSSAYGQLADLIASGESKCREEAIASCQAKSDPGILKRFDFTAARQHQLMGGDGMTYSDDYYKTTCTNPGLTLSAPFSTTMPDLIYSASLSDAYSAQPAKQYGRTWGSSGDSGNTVVMFYAAGDLVSLVISHGAEQIMAGTVSADGNIVKNQCRVAGGTSKYPACTTWGVSVDRSAGTVSFSNSPVFSLTAYAKKTVKAGTLDGSLKFTPF